MKIKPTEPSSNSSFRCDDLRWKVNHLLDGSWCTFFDCIGSVYFTLDKLQACPEKAGQLQDSSVTKN